MKVIVDEVAAKAYVAIHEDPIETEVTHTLEKHGILLHWDGKGKLMGVEFTSPDQNAPYVRYITQQEVRQLCHGYPGPHTAGSRQAKPTGALRTIRRGRMPTRAELSAPGSVPRAGVRQASAVAGALPLARRGTTAGSTDAEAAAQEAKGQASQEEGPRQYC
jgi:hypothetical protein